MTATFRRQDDGVTYQMTDKDIEWLGRSMAGETSDLLDSMVLHAWTMMNRYMLKKPQRWSSFYDCISQFSQPVNPAWITPTKEMCEKFFRQHGFDGCTEKLIARRRHIQQDPYEEVVPEDVRQFVQDFANGYYPYPQEYPLYVNFARATNRDKAAGLPGVRFGERFYTREEDKGMGYIMEGGVEVIPESAPQPFLNPTPTPTNKPVRSLAVLGGILAAVLGAGAGWFIWKKLKK